MSLINTPPNTAATSAPSISQLLESIGQRPLRQDGLNSQLHDLEVFAQRLGMETAVEFLTKVRNRTAPVDRSKHNEIYTKAKQVQLTTEQTADLLRSGCEPQFRSLAGILQDAAEQGAMHLYHLQTQQ